MIKLYRFLQVVWRFISYQSACRLGIFLLLIFGSLYSYGNGIRVDLNLGTDPRGDVNTPRWHNWLFPNGQQASGVFDGVRVTIRKAGSSGTGLKSVRHQALIYHRATLTLDGVTVDGTNSGGMLEVVLGGLPSGNHSFVSWHSFIDNVTNGSSMEVSVDGRVQQRGIRVPSRVTSSDKAAIVYTEFTATAGRDVVIRFRAEGNGSYDNVILNGFVIDGNDPSKMIRSPQPSEADLHWEQELGLSWVSAVGAASHNLYLGTDSLSVLNATPSSPEFKGNLARTTYPLNGLTTFAKYWWRVDAHINGVIARGDVLPFQIARLSFPTAEGYGRYARAGRGGRVVFVTNLNDSGAGSLRDALEVQKGPRTVIFRVGGTIMLNKRLTIPRDGGDVYIAGQTAPGEGICVARYGLGALGASDVVIRFIRNRVGDYANRSMDGIGLASCDYSIVDHCSISWTVDEGTSSRWAKNITFQRNIVSECLNNSVHSEGKKHSFAGSISGDIGSFHHNLLAHCGGRNWSLAGGFEQDGLHQGGKLDITNNVVYNWQGRTTDGQIAYVNFVNNYYKAGAASTLFRLFHIDADELNSGNVSQVYLAGNKMINASGGVLLNPSTDNWTSARVNNVSVDRVKKNQPLYPSYVNIETADQAYLSVLNNVGVTYPRQDAIDKRIINEVRNGTYTYTGSKDKLKGIIDSQNDVGGYPGLQSGTAPVDSDNDGMPDSWEIPRGLNPNKADNNEDRDGDGYTNLEEYLGCLVGEFSTCDILVPKDCNGDEKGTATLDDCGICTGGKTGRTACLMSIQGEDFCEADGFLESRNTGFRGEGYINFDNIVGASGRWTLYARQAVTARIGIRYANGSAEARGMTVFVNGMEQGALSGAGTGGWAAWIAEYITLSLSEGVNVLELRAISQDGPNIDLLAISTEGLSAGGCIEDCNGVTGGGAYTDQCGICVGGNTGKTACVQDCAGTWGGNAEADACGVCLSINAGYQSCSGSLEAEEACEVDGILLEDRNGGFSGAGYVNTTNALGSYATWFLESDQSRTVTLTFRYANSGTVSRDGRIVLNGEDSGLLQLPPTGSWSDWGLSTVLLDLKAGINELTLVSATEEGLANLDILYFSAGVSSAGCTITGLSGALSDQSVSVYPNPTTGMVRWASDKNWMLLNMQGKILRQGFGSELNMADYTNGVYLLKLENTYISIVKN